MKKLSLAIKLIILKSVALFFIALTITNEVCGQYSITGTGIGNTYTQNFDAFRGTTGMPANWAQSSTANATLVVAGTTNFGTATANNCYAGRNSSSGSDYACIFKVAAATPATLTFSVANNTGSTINGFVITWNAEQYSQTARATTVDFTYRLGASAYGTTNVSGTTLTTATTSGTDAVLATVSSTARSITITGISLSNLGTADFRFTVASGGSSGNNCHLGIDDFTIYATSGSSPTLSAGSLSSGFGNQCINTTSSTVPTFTVTGSDLTSAQVSISGDAAYTFATTLGGSYSNPLNISQSGCSGSSCYSQTIYVKFTPTAVSSYNGNISVSGGGASSGVTTAVTGSGIDGTPALTTVTANTIGTQTASSGGNTLSTACGTISAKGVVWGTSANPTVPSVNSTSDGSGTANYTSNIIGLTENTVYNYRAYATNSNSTTGYGSNLTFTTISKPATSPAANTATSDGFTATWSAPTGQGAAAYTYTIEANTASDFSGTATNFTGVASSPFVLTGLSSTTTYYYRIKVVNAGGSSTWVNFTSGITTLAGPCLSDFSGYSGWTLTGASSATNQACTGNGLLFTASGQTVVTPAITNPDRLNFNTKRSSNTTAWDLKVQISTSASGPWTDVTNIGLSTTTCAAVTEINLSSYTGIQYLRFLDNRASGTHERGIDDITVTCLPAASDINVLGNGVSIPDGTTTTGTADHTQFAATEVGLSSTRTFTITNAGSVGTINLTGTPRVAISGSSAFTVTTQPASSALNSGASTTFVVTFSPTNLITQTATISIDNDDPDVAEQIYTFNVSGTGTYSQLSSISVASGFTPPNNIAYISNTSSSLTLANSIEVGRFTLKDGNPTDNDNAPTILNAITFSVSNSSNIQKVALFDGSTQLGTTQNGAATVTFSGLSLSTVTDGGTKDFSLRVTYNTTVTDNQQYQFTITSATASASGSGFATANAGGASTSVSGNDNRINVTATAFVFGTQPTTTSVNTNISPFTLRFQDANGNLDFDNNRTVTLTTTGVNMSPASPSVTITATHTGIATFSSVMFTSAPQTGIRLTATCSGFSNVQSNTFDITSIVYANGDYRSIGSGNWVSNNATPAIWERLSGGVWAASNSPSYSTTNNVYIQNGTTVTTAGAFGNNVNLKIQNGGTFNCNHASTAANIYVYGGGTLNANASLTMASGGNFDVEDNADVFLNFAFANPSTSIWNGIENFRPNSNLYIWDWKVTGASNMPLINNNVTTNTYNSYTAAFGNIYIDLAGSTVADHWEMLGNSYGTTNLCHGNFEIISPNGYDIRFVATAGVSATVGIKGNFKINSGWSSARTCILGTTTSNVTLNLKGNFEMDCAGDFTVRASNSSGGGVTMNIDGDLLMNGANTTSNTNFKLNQNSYGTANGALSRVNLKGNLTVGSVASIINSGAIADQQFNFTGTTIQLVNVGSAVGTAGTEGVAMAVKSGATVQLSTNNLVLDKSSTLTVENGGVLDFNWATNGITPLLVTQPGSPSGTPAFTLNSGGTIKITSTDASGSIASAGNAYGNVRTTNRTYDVAGIYHFIGKSDQVAGNGLPTGITSGKLIMEMNTTALTLKLSASTSIGTGQLGLVKGLLILDNKNITLGASATVTGTPSANNMVVTNSTGEFIKTYSSPGSFTYPVGDNVGTVEYSPVALTFTGSVSGNVGVIVTDGIHSNIGSPSNYLSRYWNFSNTLGNYNYTAVFTYVAADVIGSLTTMKAARYSGSGTVWNGITGSNATGTLLSITSSETQATSPLNSAFTGMDICTPGTWTGNGSDAFWSTAANWCGNTIPTSATNVDIPNVSNDPIVNNTIATCNNLNLQSGATLGINNASAITVNGAFTNNGTVNVANNGNFIQTTGSTLSGSGIFNVTRNGSASPTVFNYWSSPVTSANTNLLGSGVYRYNPATGTCSHADDNPGPDPGWIAASGVMSVGKGYAARGAGTVTFTGTANNGSLSSPVLYYPFVNGSLASGSPFNLWGNPYPSNIDAASFLSANSANVWGAIYYWDDDNSGGSGYSYTDYAVWNGTGSVGGGGRTPNGMIASCQGVFLEVKSSSPATVTANNSMRVSTATTFFKSDDIQQRIWLSTTDGQVKNQTLIGYINGATSDLDWFYDARKLSGNNLSLYSISNDTNKLSIQGLAPFTSTPEPVKLGFVARINGQYSIYIDSLESFPNDLPITLEDAQLGIVHDLRNGPYTFQAQPGENNNRFILFPENSVITNLNTQDVFNLNIFPNPNNGSFNLQLYSGIEATIEMELYTVSGQLISSSLTKINAGNTFIPFNIKIAGVYLLKVTIGNEVVNRRIIVH